MLKVTIDSYSQSATVRAATREKVSYDIVDTNKKAPINLYISSLLQTKVKGM